MTEPQQLAAIATLWKRTGRELTTRFTGASMRPAIDDGAEVTLLCVDNVRLGDVVAYVYGDRVIVHRIVAQWGDRFIARGDANVLPDPVLLDRGDVIGKLVQNLPARTPIAASAADHRRLSRSIPAATAWPPRTCAALSREPAEVSALGARSALRIDRAWMGSAKRFVSQTSTPTRSTLFVAQFANIN
ncbi:MAG: hypothetical protein DMF58_06125 [Acidobacteria bacterium]|nr:MAG: hypothetical protein DMF58_06125 [Acidobacteriota bacterium]